jgi:phospholipid:diacylglycerol acyltransferase
MSFLRRRWVEEPTKQPVGDSSSSSPKESLTLVRTAKLTVLKEKRSKRRNGLIFTLGGIFGIILAAFFANHHDVISFEGLMDLNLDSLIDVIPAGIVKEARDITVCHKIGLYMYKRR